MDEWHYSIGLVNVCPNSDLQGKKQFSAPLRVTSRTDTQENPP